MSREFGWKAQQRVGKWGVRQVSSCLVRLGYVVESVENDKNYFRQDIDLLVRGAKRKRWTTCEVKTDLHETGNVYLETRTAKGRPGCVFASRAQVWLYWFPNMGILLTMRLPDLQLWLAENMVELSSSHTITSRAGKKTWDVSGYTVPIERLVSDGVAVRLPLKEEEECLTESLAA